VQPPWSTGTRSNRRCGAAYPFKAVHMRGMFVHKSFEEIMDLKRRDLLVFLAGPLPPRRSRPTACAELAPLWA
jgi:hypothetical protein